jgi:hypothetical protein
MKLLNNFVVFKVIQSEIVQVLEYTNRIQQNYPLMCSQLECERNWDTFFREIFMNFA